jgi:hypothetical protein
VYARVYERLRLYCVSQKKKNHPLTIKKYALQCGKEGSLNLEQKYLGKYNH